MANVKSSPTATGREVDAEALTGKRRQTRRRLLESTFKLIGNERGMQVRIEEICADAKVSRATFYNYFTSLEELFASLTFELSHDFNSALIATLQTMTSRSEGVNAAVQHYLKNARRDPAWGWAMVHLSAHGPLFGAENYQACGMTIAAGMKAGEFDIPNMQLGRDLLMGTLLASMITLLREGGSGPRSQSRHVAQHVLRALGVSETRARNISESALPEIIVSR